MHARALVADQQTATACWLHPGQAVPSGLLALRSFADSEANRLQSETQAEHLPVMMQQTLNLMRLAPRTFAPSSLSGPSDLLQPQLGSALSRLQTLRAYAGKEGSESDPQELEREKERQLSGAGGSMHGTSHQAEPPSSRINYG